MKIETTHSIETGDDRITVKLRLVDGEIVDVYVAPVNSATGLSVNKETALLRFLIAHPMEFNAIVGKIDDLKKRGA